MPWKIADEAVPDNPIVLLITWLLLTFWLVALAAARIPVIVALVPVVLVKFWRIFPVIVTVFESAVEPITFSIPVTAVVVPPPFSEIVLLLIVTFALVPACP